MVQVHWHGPFTIENVCSTEGDWAKRQGLYQVYGQHVVFGPDALLYIGMTNSQNFGSRFEQHGAWFKYESDVRARLGIIDDPGGRNLLAEIEALTIWWHSPPYNSKNIWQYSSDVRLHVRNQGERGRLASEYMSHWGDWAEAEVTPPEGEHP